VVRSLGADHVVNTRGGDGEPVALGSLIGAPFCGTLMAEFGADVIKVEDPDVGDMSRHLDYATLSKDHPRLVMAHVSGFGQTGSLPAAWCPSCRRRRARSSSSRRRSVRTPTRCCASGSGRATTTSPRCAVLRRAAPRADRLTRIGRSPAGPYGYGEPIASNTFSAAYASFAA
jgi:hypothetical protein